MSAESTFGNHTKRVNLSSFSVLIEPHLPDRGFTTFKPAFGGGLMKSYYPHKAVSSGSQRLCCLAHLDYLRWSSTQLGAWPTSEEEMLKASLRICNDQFYEHRPTAKALLWTPRYRGCNSLNPAQVHLLCAAVHTQRLVSSLWFALTWVTLAAFREPPRRQLLNSPKPLANVPELQCHLMLLDELYWRGQKFSN